jgi:hypothetical protein
VKGMLKGMIAVCLLALFLVGLFVLTDRTLNPDRNYTVIREETVTVTEVTRHPSWSKHVRLSNGDMLYFGPGAPEVAVGDVYRHELRKAWDGRLSGEYVRVSP